MEGLDIQQELPRGLFSRQLAAAVRGIHWSYAIFWALSTRQQGVLAWRDGYYNGEIKTRKTTQATELQDDQQDDQTSLHRSEQLRELYGSLSAEDRNQQSKRPSASLSPEDLTDMEWYYVVCMSFTYNPGEGLPGRALASNQHIWVTNASFADSQIFSRSILAKSASVQTVVCFPFMDGVLELGTSELVNDDPAFIQHVKTCFWELPKAVYTETSISSSPGTENDEDVVFPNLDAQLVDSIVLENDILANESLTSMENGTPGFPFTLPSDAPVEEAELIQDQIDELHDNIHEHFSSGSPDDIFSFLPDQHIDDTLGMEALNRTCHDLGKQPMDDDFTNDFHGSCNPSDCLSQSFLNPQLSLSSPKGERVKANILDYLQGENYANLVNADINDDNTHYTRTLSDILRNSRQLVYNPCFGSNSHESSFSAWQRNSSCRKPFTDSPQKLLKKILEGCVSMHNDRSLRPYEDTRLGNNTSKPEGDDASASHVISERRRREKLNEKFIVLKSLVPSITKADKASILSDTIQYLKELEGRVEELESCREPEDLDPKERQKHLDISERTSDNYGSDGVGNCRRPARKRKACEVEEAEAEHVWILMKDGPVDVNVTVSDKEVLVEMHCPWRDCLLIEIVEALSNLHLDAHSVQSSTTEGILALTLRAKVRGPIVASPGRIKKALQRIANAYDGPVHVRALE
uniref:BHLH1 n=1 Tax=Tulipa fosteriana TaxID=93697 RepID=A0A0C4G609_9LILI|nr:bHLH1 [Tulipa fosteriana]